MINKPKLRASLPYLFCAVAVGLAMVEPSLAGGLSKVKTSTESFKAELDTIIPIIAIVGLAGTGLAYAFKMAEKDTLVRIAGGILIAGSAAEIVAMFWG